MGQSLNLPFSDKSIKKGFDKVLIIGFKFFNRRNVQQPDNENLTYDSRGNILTLNRQGYYTSGATCAYNTIDNLTYNYSANTNKLNTITESASATYKSFGFNPGAGGVGYTYDVNGNLKTDSYKGITNITYNFLNLPSKIEWATTKSIEFVYSASGEKLAKTVKTGSTINYIQHYVGGIEYNSASGINRRVEAIYHGEGRFFNTNTGTTTPTYRTEFSIKDHLGVDKYTEKYLNISPFAYVANLPLSFTDMNGDSLKVSLTDQNAKKAFSTFFGTKASLKYLSQFAAKDQKINGYTFKENGKFHNKGVDLKFSDKNFGKLNRETQAVTSGGSDVEMVEGRLKLEVILNTNSSGTDLIDKVEAIAHETFLHVDEYAKDFSDDNSINFSHNSAYQKLMNIPPSKRHHILFHEHPSFYKKSVLTTYGQSVLREVNSKKGNKTTKEELWKKIWNFGN